MVQLIALAETSALAVDRVLVDDELAVVDGEGVKLTDGLVPVRGVLAHTDQQDVVRHVAFYKIVLCLFEKNSILTKHLSGAHHRVCNLE